MGCKRLIVVDIQEAKHLCIIQNAPRKNFVFLPFDVLKQKYIYYNFAKTPVLMSLPCITFFLSKLCLPQAWIKAMATHRIAADHIASVTTKYSSLIGVLLQHFIFLLLYFVVGAPSVIIPKH